MSESDRSTHEAAAVDATVRGGEIEVIGASRRRLWLDILFPLGALALLLILWGIVVALFEIPKYIIPSPASVFEEMANSKSALISNAAATGGVAALGLIFSVLVGVPIGLLVGEWHGARRVLMPPLVAIQSLPKIALAPLFVAWLGFGAMPKLIITVLITFFPLTLATIVGVESITRATTHLAASMGCRGWRMVRLVVLPTSAPFISAAFRTCSTLAVVGALVAEFVGSSNGLGNMLLLASGNRDTPLAFAAIIAVALLGILFYAAAAVATRLATLHLGAHYMRGPT